MKLRQVNPLYFVAAILFITFFMELKHVSNLATGFNEVNFMAVVFSPLCILFAIKKVLDKITQGNKNLQVGYQGDVLLVGVRHNNPKWSGRFRSKKMASFSVQYHAWKIDHFGSVNQQFGISYGVKKIQK